MAAGMSPAESDAKGDLFERAARSLPGGNGRMEPLREFFVPGRIEVLGKHTDYAGGRSLLGAVERGFCLIARPRRDDSVQVVHTRSKSMHVFRLDPCLPIPEGHWTTYPATVVRRVARNFLAARRGADIAFISDLPAASGLSSSSALIVAIFLALADINDLTATEEYRTGIGTLENLAGYLGTVENGENFGALTGDMGVGTFGGSEDHTAILCSQARTLKQYSFCPIRHERSITWPEGFVFVIGMSGVVAIKTGSARAPYNRAALAVRKILQIWREAGGHPPSTLAAAVMLEPGAADRIREVLRRSSDPDYPPGLLCDRFEHFLEESTSIVPAATEALAARDMTRFGLLVDRSQRGAETLLGNQVPETMALARTARDLGAAAASAFGAGFGGAVWALVPEAQAGEFLSQWTARFHICFPALEPARFFTTLPAPAALIL